MTLSGPAATVAEASRTLTDAGHWVLSAPPFQLPVEEDETLLSVETDDADIAQLIQHLGWRHRASIARMGRAVKIGGQG
jgi:hypothetical protein